MPHCPTQTRVQTGGHHGGDPPARPDHVAVTAIPLTCRGEAVGLEHQAELTGSAPPLPSTSPGRQRLMSSETEIRPFHVEVSDETLADLRRRIAETRWPR